MNRPSFKKDNIDSSYTPPGSSFSINMEDVEVVENGLGNLNYNKSVDLSALQKKVIKVASYDESEIEESHKYFNLNKVFESKNTQKGVSETEVKLYKVSEGVTIMVEFGTEITKEQLSIIMKILKSE